MTRTRTLAARMSRPCWMFLALALCAGATTAQLVTAGNHRIFQPDAGGLEEPGDHFGAALASGDFDGDGFWDLAIGAPDEDVVAIADAGAVFVVYGEPAGPGQGARIPLSLHQDVTGVQDVAEPGDRFGAALAVGDFNGDGFDDLAVGVPGEGVPASGGGTYQNAGAFHVFPGGPAGLDATADFFANGDSFPGIYSAFADEDLGATLARCDRNGDGRDELIVGVPGAFTSAGDDTGAILILFGSVGGVTTSGAQYYSPSQAAGGDRTGTSIACGDADHDGLDDIAVGAPFSEYGTTPTDGGTLWLLRSSGATLLFGGGASAGDHLGAAVVQCVFSQSSSEHVVVGKPGSEVSGQQGAGKFAWYYLNVLGSYSLAQGTDGIAETAEPSDHFGEVLAFGDFNYDGLDDIVAGVPEENLSDGLPSQKLDAGVVQVVPGAWVAADHGDNDQLWSWDAPIGFGSLANDHFGGALAVGDFDRNGVDDLAIGAPNASWNENDTGIVQILYAWPPGWIFGDAFESRDTRKWGP
jgi:FG-GAP repeat